MIVIYERFKFYSRCQKQGESIADFVAGIKALAHTCDFGEQLNAMLRDRFVMGIAHAQTQHHLLTEADLTFKKAVELATAREAAIRDVSAMGNSSNPTFAISNDRTNSSTISRGNRSNSGHNKSPKKSSDKPKSKCSGCGALHWKRDCPYRNKECFSCKRVGHISKMCCNKNPTNYSSAQSPKANLNNPVQSNGDANNSFSYTGDYDYVFNVLTDSKVPPILVSVMLNNCKVNMEFDTGATRSLLPKSMYYKLWPVSSERPALSKSYVNLHGYGGSPLKVLGEIQVDARLENSNDNFKAKLVIIDGEGPGLLGRDLIYNLNLSDCKLNDIHKVSLTETSSYPELFSPGLGCLKDRTFSIEVDKSISPKFCKARTVPYALRSKVDLELDRLTNEGIISPNI